MESEVVGKIDVASRQIAESVRLFFDRRDPIVIHTVIAAAHQILFDLSSKSGVDSSIKKIGGLGKADVREFLNSINYPYNFFKHADRDSDSAINIGPLERYTQDFVMDAVVMLQRISKVIPFEAKVFWCWFVSYYPDEFSNLPADGVIAQMQEHEFGKLPFRDIAMFIKMNDVLESDT